MPRAYARRESPDCRESALREQISSIVQRLVGPCNHRIENRRFVEAVWQDRDAEMAMHVFIKFMHPRLVRQNSQRHEVFPGTQLDRIDDRFDDTPATNELAMWYVKISFQFLVG